MPFYNFINKETGEQTEELLTFDQKDQFLIDNPHLEQKLCAPAFGDSIRLGLKKPDSAFRDRLQEIKKSHSKGFSSSTVNTF